MSFAPVMHTAPGDPPRVTVLMSVYNGEKHLRQAVESILAQTFTDFEFLIINDGSTDGTRDILQSYTDERLRILDQDNRGLVRSLNTGLRLARGQYVARMDADDVSHPTRLELQIQVLDSNPNIHLVAAFCRLIDRDGRLLDRGETETDGIYSLWILQFRNVYVHGSVTYRRRPVVDLHGYSKECLHAEDYDLWLRMTSADSAVIIPTYLYDLRIWPDSISQRFREMQQTTATEISCRNLRLCNPSLTDDDLAGMRPLYSGPGSGSLAIAGLKSLKGAFEGFCVRYGIDGQNKRTLLSRVTRDMIRGVMASDVISTEDRARFPEIMWALMSDTVPPEEVLGILWDEAIAVHDEHDNTLVRLAVVVEGFLARLQVKYPAIQPARQVSDTLLKSAARLIRRLQ